MSQLTPSSNIVALYEAINGQAPGYTVYNHDLPAYTSGTAQAGVYLNQVGLTDAATALTQVFGNLGLATTATSSSSAAVTAQAGLYTAMVSIINTPANNISLAYGVNWLVNALATIPSTDANYANYSAASTTLNTNVTNGVSYSGTTTNGSPEAVSSLTAVVTSGKTLTLTTGVDSLTGTSSNDTFIADNTGGATKQTLGVADTINGVGGTDTLKVYLYDAETAIHYTNGNVTNIADLYLNGGGSVVQDFSGSCFTSITLDNIGHGAAATDTITLKGSTQSITMENHTSTTVADTVNLDYQTADTAATVTLSNMVDTTVNVNAGASVATLNLVSSGTTNTVTLTNTAAALTTLNISGAGGLTLTTSLTGLKTINASSSTGAVTIDDTATVNASFAFTGGSGGDTLELTVASLEALTAGSQLNGGTGTDTLNLNLTGGAFTAGTTDYKELNATTGFQVLGLGIAGDTNTATVNASLITAGFAKHFAVNTTGAITLSSMADGSTVDILAAPGAANTFGGAVGAHILNLNVGNSSSGGLSGGAHLQTVTGWSTINLTSNGKLATDTNTLVFTNSDNTTFTITGSDALNTAVSAASATGDTINASALTGALTMGATAGANVVATAVGDSGKGDVIKTGSGTTILVTAQSTTGDTVTLLSGHTKVDTIDATKEVTYLQTTGNDFGSSAAMQTAMVQVSNFNSSASASDVLKVGTAGGNVVVGSATDINTGATHTYTASNGFVSSSGVTAAQFLADIYASTGGSAGHVIAFTDGTNTYVATVGAGHAGGADVVELVGVSSATHLGTAAAANTIHIA